MKTRAGLCLGVAALLILAVLVGAAQRDASQPAPGQIGDPAAPLTGLQWIKAGPVQLERGSIYVVEFWATWCPPCRTSIPHLTEIQRQFKDRGVTIIGISDETADIVKPFVAQMDEQIQRSEPADGVPHVVFIAVGVGESCNSHRVGGLS